MGYRTLRDHAFTVDGGTVRNASRLEPGSNRGWRIEVRPNVNVNDDVTVVLPVTTDCNDDGAICTEDGRKLSSRVELTVNGPEQQAVNSPATGAPTISGTAQVGGTLTADTSGVADDDGLTNAAFSYHWQADGADISGATASTYTLADADKGAAISVTVSFTDDAGNEESLTSAATAAVEAAPHAPQEAQGAAGDDAAEPTDRPHGLTAEASGGTVVLTWKAPEGYRSDYRILRNRPELGEAEPLVYVAYTDTTDVTYTDTDVEPGVLYVYSVTALDFLGDAGEASRPVEIRMQATSQQQTANSPATGAPTITGTA